MKTKIISEFEEIVLLAILKLDTSAYGVSIRQTVEEATQRFTSVGAIYVTLDRLEQKGFISSKMGEATPERGGRAKKYYSIEGAGKSALQEAEAVRRRLYPAIQFA